MKALRSRRRVVQIGLGAALVVGAILVLVLTGGDDNPSRSASATTATSGSPDTPATTPAGKGKGKGKTTPARPPKPRAPNPTIKFASDRSHKNYALAQATGSIKHPAKVSMQVGAAPKQPVTINWNVVCLFADGAKTTSNTLTQTPPLVLQLTLPPGQAKTCTVSAQAQLTLAGVGRVKVFLLGQRR
ncbi:MAG: hypothetical protein QOG15_1374 [Solirubrobacteraceae bacterium]|jgi:hypothetical protein|nr:hypothetical protein [Solirubrobacteraceae bacterium]